MVFPGPIPLLKGGPGAGSVLGQGSPGAGSVLGQGGPGTVRVAQTWWSRHGPGCPDMVVYPGWCRRRRCTQGGVRGRRCTRGGCSTEPGTLSGVHSLLLATRAVLHSRSGYPVSGCSAVCRTAVSWAQASPRAWAGLSWRESGPEVSRRKEESQREA